MTGSEEMDELDVNGILITEFPCSLTLEESRERLEMLAWEWLDKLGDMPCDDQSDRIRLTPFNVFGALYVKHDREIGRMTEEERNAFRCACQERWRKTLDGVRERMAEKHSSAGLTNRR